MKILIVDDDPTMLLTMKQMLSNIANIKIVGALQDKEEVFAFLCMYDIDIAFLAIKHADELEFARKLRLHHVNLDLVFIALYPDYAIQAYDVYPLDYMLLPIENKRLLQTLERAKIRRYGNSPYIRRLTIQALGCFEVTNIHHGQVKWISKKSEELFAYLVLKKEINVPKLKVIEDIFPNMPLKNAESYLNTAVYQLRKALDAHGLKDIVISEKSKYRLTLRHVDVDFIQFEQGIELVSSITRNNVAAALELEKQFTGELFEDKSFIWSIAERERLNMLYCTFAKELISWLFACKQFAKAFPIIKRVIMLNPFDEEANQLLLHLLGTVGNQYSLQLHYNQYVQLMQQELHAEPSIKMHQLYHKYKEQKR